jgi:predicted 3-demethylubiquinone-9 3-methyltransferase (glyoxalase superfamily)
MCPGADREKKFVDRVGERLAVSSLGQAFRQGRSRMQKITPFLWFDGQAEEAMAFYTSVFKNSKVVSISRYGDAGPAPKGTVMTATFELEGQKFIALNGGPHFKFSPAISFFVSCETQAEVDELWDKLVEGGEPQRCGWLKDKYGLSWQIIPAALGVMLQDKDPKRSSRVMQAMLQMVKIDIGGLQQAYDRA